MRLSLTLILAVALAGCSTVQGIEHESREHRYIVTASAYTLQGCQDALDKIAGRPVAITSTTSQVGVSILNLGLLPAYECQGVVSDH